MMAGNGDDDDNMTYDDNTVQTRAVIRADGTCALHPHIKIRESINGETHQRDSCPECDKEHAENKLKIEQKKSELERQLKALEDTASSSSEQAVEAARGGGSGGGGGSKAVPVAEDPSTHSRVTNTDPGTPAPPPTNAYGMAPAQPSPYGSMYPGAQHGSMYPGYSPYGQPPPPGSGVKPGTPAAAPGTPQPQYPPPPHHPYGMPYGYGPPPESFYGGAPPGGPNPGQQQQMFSQLQQVHDQVVKQKDEEIGTLRAKVDEQSSKIQSQAVELALLREKLAHQDSRLEQEKKLAKLEADAASQEKIREQVAAFQSQWIEQHQEQQRLLVQQQERLKEQQAAAAAAVAASATTTVGAGVGSGGATLKSAPPPYKSVGDLVVGGDAKLPKPELDKSEDLYDSGKMLDYNKSNAPEDNDMDRKPEASAATAANLSKHLSAVESSVGDSEVRDQFDQGGIPWSPPTFEDPPDKQNQHEPESTAPTAELNNNIMNGTSSGGGVPINEVVGDDGPPAVPLDENITFGSTVAGGSGTSSAIDSNLQQNFNDVGISDRFDPNAENVNLHHQIVEDEDDQKSLGQTVASSTYGEDRQKVIKKQLLDPYGDKGIYTGVVLKSTGMPHGSGKMVYEEDGRIYDGDWRHGRWHGFGKASFSNGDNYEGEYKFDQRHGRGIYRWNDGRVYDGMFSEDKRHGKGNFTWPDGAIYDGEFVSGQREGHGQYTFSDGGQYIGSWKDGRYDGYGTCTWEDGRRYRGEWRNGMAHGRGTETYPNGNIRHEGQWIDDEPIR